MRAPIVAARARTVHSGAQGRARAPRRESRSARERGDERGLERPDRSLYFEGETGSGERLSPAPGGCYFLIAAPAGVHPIAARPISRVVGGEADRFGSDFEGAGAAPARGESVTCAGRRAPGKLTPERPFGAAGRRRECAIRRNSPARLARVDDTGRSSRGDGREGETRGERERESRRPRASRRGCPRRRFSRSDLGGGGRRAGTKDAGPRPVTKIEGIKDRRATDA